MTTHELVVEMRDDVKSNVRQLAKMSSKVDILASQDLDARLDDVESWKDQIDGRVSVLTFAVGGIGAAITLFNFIL